MTGVLVLVGLAAFIAGGLTAVAEWAVRASAGDRPSEHAAAVDALRDLYEQAPKG